MKYSFIIPVYNRPGEVDELLCSISQQTLRDFEVIVVEDGSAVRCEDVVAKYKSLFDLKYVYKENGGPGPARNYGAGLARGEYLLILDSDTVLPETYLQAVDSSLAASPAPAFGGPDRAHESFTCIQKAINYSMTSFFTTGGIRGGKKKLLKFYPRSFNMGIRKNLFDSLGGFSTMRFGEDMDLSMRIFESGNNCALYREAWLWHKRRADLRKFFRQTYNSGIARVNLEKRHPGSTKPVHLLPAAFTVGIAILLITAVILVIVGKWALALAAISPLLLYSMMILIDSSIKNRSVRVGLLSVPAAFVQLTGYGSGYIKAFIKRVILSQPEFSAYKKNFYK